MGKIHVAVSRPYDVIVEHGLIDEVGNLIKPYCLSNRVAIITDDNVSKMYLEKVEARLVASKIQYCSFVFPNGESSKCIKTLSNILEFLAANHFKRNDTLLALGGGVVGDIVGLAGSLYMRGISVIQVPTTLLSAVDSSVGGKTAVDLKAGKNLVGAFWQPSMVICDVDIIDNLPEQVFNEGMSEVIKCSLIRKMSITEWIDKNCLKDHLEEVISECIQLKRDIVEEDEFDNNGIRNVLNVGHTFAHAIEKLSGYSISHGHAVGTGLVIESRLACLLGKSEYSITDHIEAQISKYCLMETIKWPPIQIVEAMKSDKKNCGSSIVFELPLSWGETQELKLDSKSLLKLIENVS